MDTLKTVGVVVGRFQAHYLHEGYRHLLDTTHDECNEVVIVVGVAKGWASGKNSLDFKTRELMLNSAYPKATILKINDCPSDTKWSIDLDSLINETCGNKKVILYGSRDSFLKCYKGKYEQKNVRTKTHISSTILRERVKKGPINSQDFRAGVIYAGNVQNFPTSFQTVDIAVKHGTEKKVLVGRKHGEDGWRFPGGFVDPTDSSLELAARREALEELGDIAIGDIKYIKSMRIDDYRYRYSEHKIMTALFSAKFLFGRIKASDDLDEARFQTYEGLVDCLVEEHKPLGEAFLESEKKKEVKDKGEII